MTKIYFFIISLLAFVNLNGQVAEKEQASDSPENSNSYIISYLGYTDVGFLWKGEVSQNERLGFIGDEYERFQIHFNSIIQNFDNPFEYLVYGKSKVKNNICEFQGSIIISEVGFDQAEGDDFSRGFLKGDYLFYEDPSCMHSGIFQGEFYTNFYLEDTETLYYDDIDSKEASFTNNSFIGKWYHYNSELEKVCNWGDQRIPESAALDIGLTEFKPSFKYYEAGWANYEKEKEQKDTETTPWWK
ncbi:MAG: hypothetical protein K9H49_17435 [Bacteroidales bacterium]|nr:hypothetical protein [Bacteroidales bacterium]MCF8390201.1 hypothetical protein [Bacteroidales bacterium]